MQWLNPTSFDMSEGLDSSYISIWHGGLCLYGEGAVCKKCLVTTPTLILMGATVVGFVALMALVNRLSSETGWESWILS